MGARQEAVCHSRERCWGQRGQGGMDTAQARLFLVAQSYLTLCDPMDFSPPGSSAYGDSPGKNTGVGCHAFLQGIFPTQRMNAGLLHCRRILYLPSEPPGKAQARLESTKSDDRLFGRGLPAVSQAFGSSSWTFTIYTPHCWHDLPTFLLYLEKIYLEAWSRKMGPLLKNSLCLQY